MNQIVDIYCFTAVYQAIAIIMFTQMSTGTMSAMAELLPNMTRSIPLPV